MSGDLIAVTAAAGKTGSSVVRELRAQGRSVRALVRRRDERSDALGRLGADVVEVDLASRESIDHALVDVDRAYYCPPIDPRAAELSDLFVDSLKASRVRAVAVLTQWLASPNHPTAMSRAMWHLEQRFRALDDIMVTILNPGYFADNYLRVSLGMAAQFGLYANLVGESRNAPPSNDDMARVVAGVLADPARFAGERLRITGPQLIGVRDITSTLSRVFERKIVAIDTPDWLVNKIARYRGESRYDLACFFEYLVDHRQGAFAFGAPTDVVQRVTGRPAEDFETTVRSYAYRPEAQRSAAAFGKALVEFMLAPLWPGYDHATTLREAGIAEHLGARYAMQDPSWLSDHAIPATQARTATTKPAA